VCKQAAACAYPGLRSIHTASIFTRVVCACRWPWRGCATGGFSEAQTDTYAAASEMHSCVPVGGHGAWARQAAAAQEGGRAEAKAVEGARLPVGHVVRALVPRQRIVRHLIVLVARLPPGSEFMFSKEFAGRQHEYNLCVGHLQPELIPPTTCQEAHMTAPPSSALCKDAQTAHLYRHRLSSCHIRTKRPGPAAKGPSFDGAKWEASAHIVAPSCTE